MLCGQPPHRRKPPPKAARRHPPHRKQPGRRSTCGPVRILAKAIRYKNGLEQFLAHLDVDVVTGFGELRFHVSRTDAHLQTGRHGTRGHDTDLVAFGIGDLVAVTRNTAIDHLEAYQLAGNALGLLFLHERTVDEILTLDELGDPSQTGLDGRRGIVDIVAVEAETLLQAERIACTQTDILKAVLLAGFPERLPKFVGILVGDVDLATARTGIPGRRKDGILDTGHLGLDERIINEILDRLLAHFLNDLHGERSLHGELADLVRCVVDLLARGEAERLALLYDMGIILHDVGRIDHEQIGLGVDAVNEQVVHDTAAAVGHRRVLYLAVGQGSHVVAGDALQEVERLGTLDPDFAHVAHIEYTGLLTHVDVFVIDTGKLDRHVVPREFGHLRAVRNVVLGKWCRFHCSYLVLYMKFNPFSVSGVSRPGADSA